MSTLNELTINYERLQEQQRNILKEIYICELEMQQYKKIQKTELITEIKEIKKNIKNNEKKNSKILLSKQKIKHLYSLQDSSYSADRRDQIQALECELLLIK